VSSLLNNSLLNNSPISGRARQGEEKERTNDEIVGLFEI
jgi:hypothetical protein